MRPGMLGRVMTIPAEIGQVDAADKRDLVSDHDQLLVVAGHRMNLRVADIQACYEQWSAKGAVFVTPPFDRGAEIRCYMRDPDGYIIEVGQATGVLHGELAKKRPEDLPG